MEPGLGESEVFYSLLFSGFNLGFMTGGITAGLFLKCIPQWYLWLATLLSHTFGYLIYSLANQGWLLMISRSLSGCFEGSQFTLAFSYLSSSSLVYTDALKKNGEKVDEKSEFRLRNVLFAVNSVALSIGYILGTGISVRVLVYM